MHRATFIKKSDPARVAAMAWDAMGLASTHDPDLLGRIEILERQMERLKAPQYRLVRKGKKNAKS
ncbi:MAG: hypothetical protein JWQ87_5473 [Candidatus Sulfotelmatobacter sp.]|nr:hypothetical protein [Candidatus Sulfotelmatobacter sp.]